MNKTIKTLGSILFTGLFAAGLGASAFGPGTFGGVKTAAEGESAHQITLKLNGGERLVDDARSGADVSYSLNGDSLKLTHDNVRAMFGNAAPYKYEGDSYLSDATDPKGQKIFATPLLYGLFVDTDNDGTLDEGERLYCSGDTLKVTADTVLTCYYSDNGFVYSQANEFGDVQDYQVCFAKAWKDGNAPVHESGESRSYTARQMQPLYHMITAIGDLAFSTNGWCNVIKSIEIPTTVQQIGMGAFKFAFQCTSITGLTRVHTFGPEALFMAGAAEINLGDNLHHFGHYSFTLEARSSRLIVEAWQNDEAKWYADGRLEDNPTPWFGVAGPTVSAPNAYVYVPKGKTSEWYKTAHAQLKLANGSNWTEKSVYGGMLSGGVSIRYNIVKNTPGGEYVSMSEVPATRGIYIHTKGVENVVEQVGDIRFTIVEGNTVDTSEYGVYIDNRAYCTIITRNTFRNIEASEDVTNIGASDLSISSELKFELNGGTMSGAADGIYLMNDVLPAAEKEGYAFWGWATSAAPSADAEAIVYAPSSSGTLYAIYGFKVELMYNYEGKDVYRTLVARAGFSCGTLPSPIRTGYGFGGWYLDAACTQAYDTASQVKGSVRLYAKWTKEGGQNSSTPAPSSGCGSFMAGQGITIGALLVCAAVLTLSVKRRKE